VIQLDTFLPRSGWWLAYRTGVEAQFIARPGDGFAYAIVEPTGDGQWRVRNWGDCVPTYLSAGRATTEWWVAPGKQPSPENRTIDVVVVDECQADRLDRRLGPPTIRTTTEGVLVVFTAAPGRPTGDVCAEAKPFATTIELDEPLGNRQLLDGAHWPPRDATKPPAP
jgi:hypothetical protein